MLQCLLLKVHSDGIPLASDIWTIGMYPDTCLILCHSFKGDRHYQYVLREAPKMFANERMAVCVFDFRGAGESGGRYESTTIDTQINDLNSVIKNLRCLGFKRFIIGGFSLGAVVALLADSQDIIGYLLFSPCLDMKHLYYRYSKLIDSSKSDFIDVPRGLDGLMVRVGHQMISSFMSVGNYYSLLRPEIPTLAVYGSHEHITNLDTAQKAFVDAGIKQSIKILEGTDHDFRDLKGSLKALKLSKQWIENTFLNVI